MSKDLFENCLNPLMVDLVINKVKKDNIEINELLDKISSDYDALYKKLIKNHESHLKSIAKPETKQYMNEYAKKFYHEKIRPKLVKELTPDEIARKELIKTYPSYNAYYYAEVKKKKKLNEQHTSSDPLTDGTP